MGLPLMRLLLLRWIRNTIRSWSFFVLCCYYFHSRYHRCCHLKFARKNDDEKKKCEEIANRIETGIERENERNGVKERTLRCANVVCREAFHSWWWNIEKSSFVVIVATAVVVVVFVVVAIEFVISSAFFAKYAMTLFSISCSRVSIHSPTGIKRKE